MMKSKVFTRLLLVAVLMALSTLLLLKRERMSTMSLISNIDRVALASQYPTDKIVFSDSGSFDASTATTIGGYLKQYAVPHGFTRPVFTRMKWSTDQTNWVEGGLGYRSGDASFLPTIAYSDSTNVYILTGLTSGTVYYEVIGMWIDDYDDTNPAIPQFTGGTNSLFFDGSLNYQKIFLQRETIGVGTTTEIIDHDLGYLSACWVYYEALPGQVWPAISGGVSNYFLYTASMGELEYTIHPGYLTLEPNLSVNSRIWYTIYTQ